MRWLMCFYGHKKKPCKFQSLTGSWDVSPSVDTANLGTILLTNKKKELKIVNIRNGIIQRLDYPPNNDKKKETDAHAPVSEGNQTYTI